MTDKEKGGGLVAVEGLARPRLVVFVGAGDVGRAQIAATWFPTLAAETKARAIFASASAATSISPAVVEALRELGLEVGGTRTRLLTRELVAAADLIVTMTGTAGRAAVKLPGKPRRREHWSVPDNAGNGPLTRARNLRDAVRARLAMLVFMEGWGRPEISREAARVTRPRSLRPDGHLLHARHART